MLITKITKLLIVRIIFGACAFNSLVISPSISIVHVVVVEFYSDRKAREISTKEVKIC